MAKIKKTFKREFKLSDIKKFAKEYMKFLSIAKTEWLLTDYVIKKWQEKGFKNLNNYKKLKEWDKFFTSFNDKIAILWIVWKKNNFKLIWAHTDSPRLELKLYPLEIKKDVNLLCWKISFYGWFFPYIWLNTPLTLVWITYKNWKKHCFELDWFCVPDHLPHLSKNRLSRKTSKAIEWEEMKIYFSNKVLKEKNSLDVLSKKVGFKFETNDFARSLFALVPSHKANFLWIDNSMIWGYWQDDKVSCFTWVKSLFDIQGIPDYTTVVLLVDKEEIW